MIDRAIFVSESLCVRLSVLEVSQCSPSLLLAVRLNYKHCVNHLPSHLSPSLRPSSAETNTYFSLA